MRTNIGVAIIVIDNTGIIILLLVLLLSLLLLSLLLLSLIIITVIVDHVTPCCFLASGYGSGHQRTQKKSVGNVMATILNGPQKWIWLVVDQPI